jgi:hypothetical protein
MKQKQLVNFCWRTDEEQDGVVKARSRSAGDQCHAEAVEDERIEKSLRRRIRANQSLDHHMRHT